jgi:cell division transport system ATP-binding protein
VRVTGEFDSRVIRRRRQAALHMVGLAHRSNCYPSELSGGEQQRAGIARAIVNKPPIVMADEPTGNLDPEIAESIFHLLREINFAGTSVLVATHDVALVDQMGGRVVRLEQGRLAEDRMRHATA